MKDGKITLNRAVKCYEPCRLSPEDDRYGRSETFYKRYGFHFEEVWNLDGEAAYFILTRLVQLRKVGCGCPGSFARGTDETPWAATDADFKRWNTQLDKMIRGFYLYCAKDFPTEKEKKIINKALKLFAEHFHGLWD